MTGIERIEQRWGLNSDTLRLPNIVLAGNDIRVLLDVTKAAKVLASLEERGTGPLREALDQLDREAT